MAKAISFDTSKTPRGEVRDPSGQPIGGADVSFRIGPGMRESLALTAAVELAGGNLSETGRLLGISRSSVYRKLQRYEIEQESGV